MKEIGKRSQVYIGEEPSYSTAPTVTAGMFIRHLTASMDFDPLNSVRTPEKKASPGLATLFTRRRSAAASIEAILRPSGTLGTAPECGALLKAAFGARNYTALSTTVASSGAVGGCTLTSATGLAVDAALEITCPDGKKRVRFITSVNTGSGVTTWAPQLPSGQQPANGAVVKAVPVYALTSALAISLAMFRYHYRQDYSAGLSESVCGWMIDRFSLAMGEGDEPRISASGPAKEKTDAPSHPGAATQVGSTVPSGLAGEALIGNNAIKLTRAMFEMTNGIELRMNEFGTSAASEGFRMGDREITVGLDTESESTYKSVLYDLAMAGTKASLFIQEQLSTEGLIIASYCPSVEWKVPTADVPDGPILLPFKGRATEATEDNNREWLIALG